LIVCKTVHQSSLFQRNAALLAAALTLLTPSDWAVAASPSDKSGVSKNAAVSRALSPASGQTPGKAARARKTAPADGPLYAGRPEAMALATDIAQRNGLDASWVQREIGRAHYVALVSRLMQPAPIGTAKNWQVYRSRFIDPIRIQAGVKFWRNNTEALERAQRMFGVPPEIIVGIVGVETLYGQQVGTFRVIDALSTLAFDFPSSHPRAQERSAYFKGELEQLLLLARRNHLDPAALRGSYAGAMGWPQFMPGSWARFAVDFDGDGKVDLFNSATDVIGSVANYFKAFNWQAGQATHFAVSFDDARLDKEALLAPDILPTFSVASFTAKGAVLAGDALNYTGPLALIELQNGADPPSYVAGTDNFYAITRYNWSSYYAMAVIELGQEVARAVRQ